MNEIPDNMEEVPQVFELGGAVGRHATLECKQGQHDLCPGGCDCRCHEMNEPKKTISLPAEYRDGGVLDLDRMKPLGWVWNGVLHLLPGVTIEEAQGGMWEWQGEIVEASKEDTREPDDN